MDGGQPQVARSPRLVLGPGSGTGSTSSRGGSANTGSGTGSGSSSTGTTTGSGTGSNTGSGSSSGKGGSSGTGSGSSSGTGSSSGNSSTGTGGSSTGTTTGGGSTGTGTGTGTSTGTGTKTAPEFQVPADAKPTPESSGVKGAFRVNSSGKVTYNGTAFQVRGGNWFGLEGQDDNARPGAMELYIGSVFWASASDKRTIETTMKEIKATPLGFNTIRLPIAPQTLVKAHKDGDYTRTDVKIRNNDPEIYNYADSYEALEAFLKLAATNNLYVILDMHSCSNHIGWRAGMIDDGPPWTDANRENYQYKKEDKTCKTGEDAYDKAKWLADIKTMAGLPKKLGINNIMGIDCFNEPFKYSWSEWADLAKECYDAVASVNDDMIVLVEGVSGTHEATGTKGDEPFGSLDTNPNWGENIYGQQFDPVQIPRDRLCFSPHTYGPAVFVQKQFVDQSDPKCVGLEDDAAGKAGCKLIVERSNADAVKLLRKGWDEHFGYLVKEKFCVIPGEFGGFKDWPANPVKPSAATVWAHLPTTVRYDWEWQNILVDYFKEIGLTDFLYWSINPESGDTGGLYNHAYSKSNESGWGVWKGMDTEKATMLQGLK